ncbi:MAG: signal recognition particle-docking protein FtsY [Cyanobacteria bacterium]|nr:signal recognition particle-docking protein FtsY [Cyanobacteriota bacterium]
MVYDWFNRTGPSPADPSATPPDSSEKASDQSPDQSVETSPDPNAEALEWARQAYARLKAQQEEQKLLKLEAESPSDSAQPVQINTQQPEQRLEQDLQQVDKPANSETGPLSLLEQAAAQRAERQQAITAPEAPALAVPAAAELAEPILGAFDTTFTWSAEVLAAQGKRVDQVSLEEIDWLARLRQGLEKTRQGLVTQLLDNLGDDPLTPEVVDGLETTLLRADVGVEATDRALGALRQRLNQEVVDPSEGLRFLKEQLRFILDQPIEASGQPLLAPRREHLNVWLLVGVNGVGKTTTLGKLANLAVRSGYSCLIAAADTFRAAAVQQVQVWGERSNVPVISNPSANADPAAVVYDAIGAAQAKGTELVLVDTAGRLQTKHNLMEELSKVRRIVDKLAPEAVVESLLVLDASQGQNGLRQAMAFAKAAGLTGVVLTKLDGSARGGVALAVASEARLPIRFIGAGEGIRDLRPFNSFEFVEALLAR